jgi:hypothetical protein
MKRMKPLKWTMRRLAQWFVATISAFVLLGGAGCADDGLPPPPTGDLAAARADLSTSLPDAATPRDLAGLIPCATGGSVDWVNPLFDPTNCGACGVRCCVLCSQGHCIGECEAGLTVCKFPDTNCTGNYQCRDLRSDHDNCGACDRTCLPGKTCVNGVCE